MVSPPSSSPKLVRCEISKRIDQGLGRARSEILFLLYAAAIIAAGSKKFAAAALEKWSRLTQAARSTPRHRRARDGPRAQKRAAAAAADEEDEE